MDGFIETFLMPKLQSARRWILITGVMYAVMGLIYYAMYAKHLSGQGKAILLGTNLGLFAIHVGLWLWAKTSPFPAAVVALVLFVTLHTAEAVIDPSTITSGIIIKVIFLVVLFKAVSSGLEVRRLRQQRPG
ncbi:MAG: hypothetical protein ACI9MR_000616 [Myxococcota bacterium]|jgi:hypothetical protein